MPGRKSNVSTTSNGPDEVGPETAPTTKASKERDGLSVDDLSLPKSMIARLAKGVLPANTQIHKDALLALHKSATVFVSYIASGANENAIGSGKKTIAPQDVIAALKDSELDHFLERLEAELKKYNEMQCDKRNTYRKKVKEVKAAAAVKDGAGEGEDGEAPKDEQTPDVLNGPSEPHHEVGDGERPVKKIKGVNGEALPPEDDDGDDNDAEDEQDADDHDDDDQSEDAQEDEADDEEDDDGPDDTMEDTLEEPERQAGVVDEALDDDQDSD